MSDSAPSHGTRRFERARDDRVLGGVCAGLARALDVDPLVVRIATVLLGAIGGAGLLAYLVCVLIVPEQGQADPLLRRGLDGHDRGLVAGLAVLTLLVWGITADGFLGWGGFWGGGWVLVAVALAALVAMRRREDAGAPPAAPAPPPSTGPEAPSEAPTAVAPAAQHRPPSRGSRVAAGVVLVAAGATGAVLAITGTSLRWDEFTAAVVVVAGVVLVLAAPFGGARGLIPIAGILVLLTGVAAAANLDLRGGVGDREYRPTTVSELRSDYHLAAGHVVVDLRDLRLPPGETRAKVSVGFGEVDVRVPRDAAVAVRAHAAAGTIGLFGTHDDGLDAEREIGARGVTPGVTPVLRLEARVGFGEVRVVRAGDDLPPLRRHGDASSTILAGGWR